MRATGGAGLARSKDCFVGHFISISQHNRLSYTSVLPRIMELNGLLNDHAAPILHSCPSSYLYLYLYLYYTTLVLCSTVLHLQEGPTHYSYCCWKHNSIWLVDWFCWSVFSHWLIAPIQPVATRRAQGKHKRLEGQKLAVIYESTFSSLYTKYRIIVTKALSQVV